LIYNLVSVVLFR